MSEEPKQPTEKPDLKTLRAKYRNPKPPTPKPLKLPPSKLSKPLKEAKAHDFSEQEAPYTAEHLAKISKQAGQKLYGKELLHNWSGEIIHSTLSEMVNQDKDDLDDEYVEGYHPAVGSHEYVFKPSTGEGIHASGHSFLEEGHLWRDTDGKIYTYSAENHAINIIDPDE